MHLDKITRAGYDSAVVDTNKWMTLSEACAYLGITRQALYDAIKAGKIERQQIFGKPGVRRTDVMKYHPRDYKDRKAGEEPTE